MRNQGTLGRRWVTIFGAGIMLALPVSQAYGQDSDSNLELTGYFGAMLPLSKLANRDDMFKAELSTKTAFGASLDYWFGGSWGIQVMGGIAQPDLTVSTVDPDTNFPLSVELGTVDFVHGEATILYRPQLTGAAAVLLPYFGVGVGMRKLNFPDESEFEDSDDVTFIVTAGSHIRLGSRTFLRLDVRDLISSFDPGDLDESKLQNEVVLNIGLGIGL